LSFDPTASQALEVTQGWLVIQHHDGTQQHVRLSLALTTVGRSEQNVIEMLDPKLSRFHCEVERTQDGYRVRDCNSRNGTLINGEPVRGAVALSDGDRIKIGRTIMTFRTQRPDELRSDRAVPITPVDEREETHFGQDTPAVAQRRPTQASFHRKEPTPSYDGRNTKAVEALDVRHRNPWKVLAEATTAVLGATHRRELLELTVEHAGAFFESEGALIALGANGDELSITASEGVEGEARERCRDIAARALVAPQPIIEDRRALGVALRKGERAVGALVLFDLSQVPSATGKELEAFQGFAGVVAHTLTTSLMVEEVRREERAAGARRIAQDLRAVLRPPELTHLPGLAIARATTRGDAVERSFWDRVSAPPRAQREEVYLALGDVPDPEAPPPRRLRRRGERAFVSLLGQAELRGALRSLVEVMPRTADLLTQLDGMLRREASVEQVSLTLLRYDTQSGTLRFSGAGHAPILVRRANGEVEVIESVSPALGQGEQVRAAEREIALERDDQVLLVTLGATRMERRSNEPLGGILGRLGGPAHEVEVVAQRVAEALMDTAALAQPEGFTLLLLRKT